MQGNLIKSVSGKFQDTPPALCGDLSHVLLNVDLPENAMLLCGDASHGPQGSQRYLLGLVLLMDPRDVKPWS